MDIFLFRHGHAIDEAPGVGDPGRWLSGKGRKATRKVAKRLVADKKRCPGAIWTSPLVRAVQTAEILAQKARLTDTVTVCDGLSPGRDPDELVRKLAEYKGETPLVLVGHEPQLSIVAALLLGERSYPGFKKSGVLGVTWEGHGAAKITFELSPQEL